MALARVSKSPTKVPHTMEGLVEFAGTASGVHELAKSVLAVESAVPARKAAKSVTTRSGIVVTLERRPTVDRAWVVCAMSDEMMIDMEVVEGGEDREKVLDSMVKKHGGAK